MKFVIEGNAVKVFGKAVHALSRIGDEMWLDPLEKGLAVRSVNSCQSAYGCFFFTPLFFQQYILHTDAQQGWKAAQCKLNMKCVLPLFRCVAWRERGVDRCEISINIPDSRVVFRFHCRHGVTKTYNLCYQECEALQAVFPSHLCPNILKAQPKLLGDIVVHFPVSQEEVTLSVSSAKMSLKTFCEEENAHIKGMNTELSLHPDEFDYFHVGVDSAVTFCLKELRGNQVALEYDPIVPTPFTSAFGSVPSRLGRRLCVFGFLTFAESHGLPVCGQFGVAGQPVAFSVEDMMLEANVVLSTLMDQNQEDQSLPAPGNDSVVCPAGNTTTAVADFSIGPVEAEDDNTVSADGERVASSQDSEIFIPALYMSKMIQFNPDAETEPTLSLGSGYPSTTPVTPASSQHVQIRSLLFGAVHSDGEDRMTVDLPSLVYASDTEEGEGVEEELC